ncbi:uncharacterized protein LOC108594744 [Drosophila busckii]|uniref:uncharacterized protein LOC108594744 n=1 Tax=Drosophila busckii TaxID=30019 RepID=UPI00083F48DB|nr:uncharacterized protein LOC108594744 [Drosophila busckii]
MSTKFLRNCTAKLLRHQQQRNFLLPPKSAASPNVKIINNAFVPKLVFKYSPLKYYLSKLRMWKLRWTWDRTFKEHEFMEQSKQTAVSLTDILRLRDMERMGDFSTSNAYYQLANEGIRFPHESCAELLRFRQQDIRQAVPINVTLQDVLGLKYAMIDVVIVGLRHMADCETNTELEQMKKALIAMEPELTLQLEDPTKQLPYVFIELFLRFRRNYSNADSNSSEGILPSNTNRWLVSVYKISRFNIFTVPPAV